MARPRKPKMLRRVAGGCAVGGDRAQSRTPCDDTYQIDGAMRIRVRTTSEAHRAMPLKMSLLELLRAHGVDDAEVEVLIDDQDEPRECRCTCERSAGVYLNDFGARGRKKRS